jgi:hypothetical protein
MAVFGVAPVAHPWPSATCGGIFVAGVGAAVWFIRRYKYLLFHNVSEMFSIAVAFAVFMSSWSSLSYLATRPFVFLGIGYLFLAILDLLRTLKYSGTMGALPSGADYAEKLWVAARGLQALGTLVLLAWLHRIAPNYLTFVAVIAATAGAVTSIFRWNMFLLRFLEGQEVTPFKEASEPALTPWETYI